MKITNPKFIFYLLTFINLFNFCDRGIIPGGYEEFTEFILKTNTSFASPSTLIGLLQSSFIIGLIIGFGFFGHYIQYVKNVFQLTAMGCSIWLLAIYLSSLSYYINNYYFLLFSRMLSGLGEASLQCTVPPWIESALPKEKTG
jgi:MFS transporter, Spinster family, sphingosine-1-phosphate transporter